MDYSDLPQVVPASDKQVSQQSVHTNLPQAVAPRYYNQLPEAVVDLPNPNYHHAAGYWDGSDGRNPGEKEVARGQPPPPVRRICGFLPRTFYIALAIGICLVVGAVAGGVAGGILAKRASESSASSTPSTPSTPSTSSTPSSAATATHSSTTTTEGAASVTTTEIVGPTSTLYRDCPSSNDTTYSVSFGSEDYIFRKYCSRSLVDDGITLINQATTNLNSYVTS